MEKDRIDLFPVTDIGCMYFINNCNFLFFSGLAMPSVLDYDWRARLLYVADTSLEKILACETDGSLCVVIRENIKDVHAIALHPALG